MAGGSLRIRILGDIRDLTRGLNDAGTRFERFRRGATVAATAVGAGLFAMAKQVGDAASEQQQAIGGLESVFGDSTAQMMKWANGAAEAVGLSKTAYASLAAPIGASLKNAGFSMEQLGEKTNQLVIKGADLAATFGGTTEEAVGALGAALRGEFDPLERYGAALTASQISAELAARGQGKLTGAALEAAKKQATLDLIMKQTADSTGQFARESDTAAGAAAIQAAKWDDLQAKLGTALLPIMTKVGEVLSKVADFASRNSGAITTLAVVIGGLVAAVWAVNAAMAVWKATQLIITAVTKTATAVQAAFNAVMAMNPVALVVIAIAALAAGIVLLATKTQFFQTIWQAMSAAITAAWDATVGAIMVGVNAVAGFFTSVWQGAVNTAKTIWQGMVNGVTAAWNFAVGIIRTGIEWVTRLFLNFTGPGLFIKHFNTIKNVVRGAFDFVVGAVRRGIDIATSVIGRLAAIPGRVAGWFAGLPGSVGRALAGIGDKISAPFVSAFNFIRDLWNSTVGGFGFSIGGGHIGPISIPKVSFHIPEMAAGGIVDAATLAMIGEAGSEAVIPLKQIGPLIDESMARSLADALVGFQGAQASPPSGGGELRVVFDVTGSDEDLKRLFRKAVRVEAGGSAEQFFKAAR